MMMMLFALTPAYPMGVAVAGCTECEYDAVFIKHTGLSVPRPKLRWGYAMRLRLQITLQQYHLYIRVAQK